jgi:hypothetical protein
MGSVPAGHLAVLRRLVARLGNGDAVSQSPFRGDGEDVPWAVTGSTGFALQGVPVAVHDVDVQTDAAGAYEIARRFAAEVTAPVRPAESARIRSHFGALLVDGIAVEIMGDIQKRRPDGTWEAPVDVARHRRWVTLDDGLRVPVLALEYEATAYRMLGRHETAEMLEAWLRGHGQGTDGRDGG